MPGTHINPGIPGICAVETPGQTLMKAQRGSTSKM